MLLVYANGTDISTTLEENSFAMTEQLQNRKDTCQFTTLKQTVSYGNVISVYESLQLSKSAASGQKVLNVLDTYPDTNKFRVGDSIILDIKGANQATYVIDAISDSGLTVTLHTNIAVTITADKRIGRLLYSGVVMQAPQEEIGYTGTFVYKVNCVDLSYLFDTQMVVKDFPLMYAREIIGRIVYFFCPNDTSSDVDLFEAAWTQGGTGLAMSNDTDRLQGAYSQSTGTTGTGTATWTKSISSKDISAYTNARFWWKVASGMGTLVSAVKLRLGTDASNYYEYAMTNIGANYEDCWNFDSAVLLSPTATVGSPTLSAVVWMQLVVTTTGALSSGSIKFDHLLVSTGGFTIQNCQRGPMKFDDIRANYLRPTEVLDDLSKRLLGVNSASSSSQNAYVWYIDDNRDVNLYPQNSGAAPFNLSNALGSQTMNYGKLVITPDITRLFNRITIIGGDAPDAASYPQSFTFDGQKTSFTLDYQPGTPVTFTVGGAGQTVGEEGKVDETTVQWVYNFKQKMMRKTSGTVTPANGVIGAVTYYPYKPVLVRVTDAMSIAAVKALMGGNGIIDGKPITDASIGSFEDARFRGLAELRQYSNAIITATFETDYDGLHAGQIMTINDVNRPINQQFLIQKVVRKQRIRDRFLHSVTAASVMYGFIEFFQMLVKRAQKVDLTPSQLLEIILNVDDTMTFTDAYVYNHLSKTFTAALVEARRMTFVSEAGSASANGVISSNNLYGVPSMFTNWYANFLGSETGTIQFASSNYNTGGELRITTAVGGNGKEAKAQPVFAMPAHASVLYTIGMWVSVSANLTNVGTGGGLRILIKEYNAIQGGTLLATNTLLSAITSKQDYTYYTATFTSNASTTFIGIELSLYQAVGTVAFADILITPTKVESQTNPAIASFSQAS